MNKRVPMTSKPTPRETTPSADQWVDDRTTTPPETRRLTIDIPASLHSRIKVDCARRGVTMADAIRQVLERHFPEEG